MFKVTARTVLELGSELISSDAIAFYELIKNAIDAGSKSGATISFSVVLGRRDYEETKSLILQALKHEKNLPDEDEADVLDLEDLKERLISKLFTEAEDFIEEAVDTVESCRSLADLLAALDTINDQNSITISDTGSGMSLNDLKTVFLTIGTASRKVDVEAAIDSGKSHTPYLGEKGIGRLSAMRLGDHLKVSTAKAEDETLNFITIPWSDFDAIDKMIEEVVIEPKKGGRKPDPEYSGTTIEIRKLNADWTEKRVERLAIDDFSLLVNPIGKVKGQRIAVFWNKKRIDIRRLEKSFLTNANARIHGKYEVTDRGPELELRIEINNLGFEHTKETSIERLSSDDLAAALVGPKAKRIKMNKRDIDYASMESIGPFEFELHWFNRTIQRKGRSTGDYQALVNLLNQWMGVRLYRDGFRVYPYGDEADDWLDLDKVALRSKGYALNRLQLVGQVEIGRISNPSLVDQTNREGLRQTPEEAILKETIQFTVERLRDEMNRVTREQKKKSKEPAIKDETRTVDLEKRMKSAIQTIRKVVPSDHRDVVQELELMREEFARYAVEARERIVEMEKDADQMLAMAGVGLMVEVVAHELTRSAEDALDTLNSLKRKSVPDEIRRRLEGLRASMKSISKRLRILDPLSVTGRQRKERFNLDDLIREILEAHEAQFDRHGIELQIAYPDRPVEITAVKGMVVQVLENLISNSVYWLDVEEQRKIKFKPRLTVVIENNPPRVRFTDNGPGISAEYRDRIFDLFFSMKDRSRRRGLGLYIAKEAAEHNGGTLVLDADVKNSEGRFTTFDYQVVGVESD
ncbi:MAG: sensor histidine kinase [Paracoccaceae bacterium]